MKQTHIIQAYLVLLFFCPNSFGQDSFYNKIEFGKYNIGFCDTIIYNNNLTYEQYGYKSKNPLFIQIWHPLEKEPLNNQTLTFGQFKERDVPDNLESVYERLCAGMDESFISYNIKEEFHTYQEIDYRDYSYQDVLDTLKTYRTVSHYQRMYEKLDFPVIIYHHGSQGLSDENFIMAEYFASKGYIFISANYHLPYENSPYGYSPNGYSGTSNVKTVTSFAKALTTNAKVIYIGHSW